MSGALVISEECLGWARLAGFEHRSDDTAGIVVLWSATGSRYCIRQRGRGRLELSHADGGDDPHPILFAASMEILEYHLVGMFGDDVREEVDRQNRCCPGLCGRGDATRLPNPYAHRRNAGGRRARS